MQERIRIPNKNLDKVDFVSLKKRSDFNKIPATGGCYWIWTNEPVKHRFHRNRIPDRIKNGEVIYNGIAKDNVQGRVKHHLLGQIEAGWSGISLDIYPGEARSHKKKIWSRRPNTKVPYLDLFLSKAHRKTPYECEPLRNKDSIFKLFLSNQEKKFVRSSDLSTYYFRNGINIFDKKHKKYTFIVYFIVGLESLYLEYLEKRWRERFGLPRLCSYSSGR